MGLFIFWLIEDWAWIKQSKFWWKFYEKATSGNTGLNFSMICISGINTALAWAELNQKKNWGQCYQKWLFHEIFTKTLTRLFTLNFRLIKQWKKPSYSTLKILHCSRLSAILNFNGYPSIEISLCKKIKQEPKVHIEENTKNQKKRNEKNYIIKGLYWERKRREEHTTSIWI